MPKQHTTEEHRTYMRQYRKNKKGQIVEYKYLKSLKGKYNRLKTSSHHLKQEVTLTFEEYCQKVDKECYYCGDQLPFNTGRSLDRIDNSKGYTFENTVPCCPICNSMKNVYSVENFYTQISKIYNRRVKC